MEHVIQVLVARWNKQREVSGQEPLTWEEVFDRLMALHYFPAAEYVAKEYLR